MYRYGFQGQEMDDEVKGKGNSINYKYRMHDPRVGRFFAVDPLSAKYPWYSSYQFSGNRVVDAVELEGKEPRIVTYNMQNRDGSITELATGRAQNDNQGGCPTCAQEFYSVYFFETIDGVTKTYTELTTRGNAGNAYSKLKSDNSAFFIALDIYKGVQLAQDVQLASDVLATVGAVVTIVATAGAATPLVVGVGITTGTVALGLSSTKLILDLQGEFEKSNTIPSNLGASLGMAFDDLYKMIDEEYDGDIGQSMGGFAEGIITIGLNKNLSSFGLDDAFTSAGLVASWITSNDKSFDDFEDYLKEFNEIMKEYESIIEANE